METWLVPVVLIWGIVATLLAMFVGFFVTMDNPLFIPDTANASFRIANTVGQYLGSTIGLGVAYAVAGRLEQPLLVSVALVTQFVALLTTAALLSAIF